MDLSGRGITEQDIHKFLGDEKYQSTFEQCLGKEEEENEKSLLSAPAFGDYVQAFRLIQLVFSTMRHVEEEVIQKRQTIQIR